MRRVFPWLLAVGCATAGQLTTPIGNGFANACSGSQYFGSLPNPGDGFSTVSDGFMTCNTSTGLSPSVNSAVLNGNATAHAAVGLIQVSASNGSSPGVAFAGAAGYGGWNDQVTIGGGGGQAVWVIGVNVHGSIDADTAAGTNAISRVGVNAYEGTNFLQPYGASINGFAYNNLFLPLNGGNVNDGIRNSAIFFGWDYQGVWYGADSSLGHYDVNRTVWFALPFTYGTPFEFGIYIGGVAGQGSSGSAGSASYDFAHTVSWAGNSYVVNESNQTNPNFTLTSQSGFNYANALAPEPATAGLLVLAFGGMIWLKRRHA